MFPDIEKLPQRRIKAKLEEGLSPQHIALCFASNTIAKELSSYTDQTPEDFIEEIRSNVILTMDEKHKILNMMSPNRRLRGYEHFCECLQYKTLNDVEEFVKILLEKSSLISLAGYIHSLTQRCKNVQQEIEDHRRIVESQGDSVKRVKVKVWIEENNTPLIFDMINSNPNEFIIKVFGSHIKFTVEEGSIILTLIVLDAWDLANIKLDITSGAFKQRFIFWLEDMGLNMTAEEEKSVTAEITAIEEEDEANEWREEVIVTPIDLSKIGELLMDEEVYEVRPKFRGTAIIINMNKVKGCDPRTGSEHDTAKLSKLFEKLHFNPVVYEDINKQTTERMLKLELLNQSEIDPDAFILCFMSHGGRFNNKDYICCSDGELLNVDRDICGPLGRCEQLKGKPKIVIIQACRSDPTREADSLPSAVPSDKADMLISFATVPAYREKEGAYFIQTIVKIFSEEAHRFHIVDMLTKVRKEVEEKWQCQLPEDVQRLKKQFYFFPGFIKKTDK